MSNRSDDFNRLYRQGATIQIKDISPSIQIRTLGDLVLPTGQIVACDPSYDDAITPFIETVPPGRCPVSIAVIDDPKLGTRALAARLTLDDAPVQTWSLALRPGEDPSTLKPGEFFCYGVDAGLGCFMDLAAARINAERLQNDMGAYWIGLVDKAYEETNSLWLNHILDESTGANMIMFSSGWGDGCYATYAGYAADGRLVCLLTDFGLHDQP
jgi:hypothetical protein